MADRNNPANSSKTTRLRILSRPLRPARAPFYVQHATAATPLLGWWWEPEPGAVEPLGASYELAVVALVSLIEQVAA